MLKIRGFYIPPLCPPLERRITGGVLYIINKKHMSFYTLLDSSVMLKIKRRFDLLLNFTHPLFPPLERGMKGSVYL
jgi:hypothetical protein